MVRYDRLSSLFWIALSIAICEEAIRLGPGSMTTPGAGLIPLGCGLFLGILGLSLFLFTFKRKEEEKEVILKKGIRWRTLILVLVSITGYSFLIDLMGFLLTTVLWMGFVCRLGKVTWKGTVLISVITTSLCFILFVHILGIRFPPGFIKF